MDFISNWLRANYAQTLREGKRGASDEDFELLGEKFHAWVRSNAKAKMGLIKSNDYKKLIMTEMSKVTELYLKLKTYSSKLTSGYEEVFYNANRDLNYQVMLIISAVRNDDTDEDVNRKIRMVSIFVDIFASIRIFNFKKVNWNTNKYLLFKVMLDIRNHDCKTVGMVLVRALRRMDVNIDAITRFSLNQFSGRYMLHLLARFTSYVNVRMGNPSQFDIYVDRKRKGNTYDIEHILPNDYDSYQADFTDADDFQASRQMIGDLIILTRDKNRSYQDINYQEKVEKYIGDNVLAQALNKTAYQNNPQFLPIAKQYGFVPIDKFTKDSIAARAKIYLEMAVDIWDQNTIKDLAGGWNDDAEKSFFKNEKASEFTVEYYEKSWSDALKFGFLSANIGGSGKYLKNIQEGDIVYCHIAGVGFVGIGECTAVATPMKDFTVKIDGAEIPITDVQWVQPSYKAKLDVEHEIFIRVDWKNYVENQKDGYWEKGMTSVPLVAYKLNDQTTYKKVKQHFGYKD